MVGFKNRYMVVEVNLNPKREQVKDDPITLTPYNVTKAIKDSILLNFGECGLASSVGSFQGEYSDTFYCHNLRYLVKRILWSDMKPIDRTQFLTVI